MRATRRPLTARPDSQISSSSIQASSISKPKRLQKALNSLSTYINRFDQVDHTIFETVTSLNSFICDILPFTQSYSMKSDISQFVQRWTTIKMQLSNNIITINGIQVNKLIEDEINKFMGIINQVDSNPPTAQKYVKDSKNMLKGITNSLNVAKENLNKNSFDKVKTQINSLKSDITHQYEPFFRLSQIDKEWKTTIVEECRRNLDKIISFCDIGKDIGITAFPFVDEISSLMESLVDESAAAHEPKSLIPRHSPMKIDTKRSKKFDDNDAPSKDEPSKIHRIPASSRSKSEQSNSNRISRIPKPKDTPTPKKGRRPPSVISNEGSNNIKQSPPASSISSGSSAKRSAKSSSSNTGSKKQHPKTAMSASLKKITATKITNSASKKNEIVPLQQSPKITRKEPPSLSSSQKIPPRNLNFGSGSDDSDNEFGEILKKSPVKTSAKEKVINELTQFEQRFSKYVAAVGTSDLLSRFMGELRAIQIAIENEQDDLQQHITRLENIISKIDEQFEISRPLFEIEQKLQQTFVQMSTLSSSIDEAVKKKSDIFEANSIARQFETIKNQLDKINTEREKHAVKELEDKINTEMGKFVEAEETFKKAQENNAQLKKLRKENNEMKAILSKRTNANRNKDQIKKMLIEMNIVHQRMIAIQQEKRDNPEDAEEIESELDALLEQQTGVIEQLKILHE